MTEYVFDTNHDRYPVAVHVILADTEGRVLLMRRAGSGYADGQLGLPAGHVDLGETPTDCAIREVGEELGIELDRGELRPAGVMFRRSLEPRVDIFFTTSTWRGTPEIREQHKCNQPRRPS
ncbi:MAG: NUDIX domain-containing protein [Pseudonocardiaceae bacterium]